MRTLVAEAPKAIRYLMRLGAAFDPSHDGGGPALTREGGHSHNRIVHAGGDRSGAEVQRTLDESALGAGVEVLERAFALDLLVGIAAAGERQAAGVRIARIDADGDVVSVGVVTARRRRARHRRLRPGLRQHVEPAGRHRRRAGARPARRARRRATSSSCSSTRPCCGRGPDADRPAGAGQRGRARRGRHPVRRRRRAGDGRRPPAGGPRAARRGRRGDQPADGRGAGRRRRPRLPRRHAPGRAVLRALPVDHRGVPRRSASTRRATASRSPRPRTSPAAACAPTSTGAPSWPGCTPSARSACTGVHGANRLASNSLTEGVVAGTRVGRDLAWELPERVEPERRRRRRRPRSSTRTCASTSARRCRATSASLRRPEGLAAAAGDARRARRRRRPRRGAHPAGVGGDEPADRRRGRRRRGDGAHREPRLPSAHRLPRARATCGSPTSTCASTRSARPRRPASGRDAGERCVAMITFHPTRPTTRGTGLLAAGLDPDAVAALVRMAVAEDLDGGIDVTSTATVPADQRSVGDVRRPRHGAVAGLARRGGGDRRGVRRRGERRRVPRRRRRPGAARRRGRAVDGADPAAAHRRAHAR